jgi:hypothetical protein
MKNTLLPLQLFVRPEHDDPQPLILYHGRRCPDGYGAALDMEPRSFERWAEIAAFTPGQEAAFMARGGAMDEKFQKLCSDIAEAAQPLVFNGMQGLMVNCPGMFHSQVGDLLARQSGSFALMCMPAPRA